MINKDLVYREFGIALAAERRRRHLTQAQLGAKVGLSRTSVTNIECGRQPIQVHQLYQFASILQVDASKLLPKEQALVEVSSAADAESKKASYIAEVKKAVAKGEKR